MELKGSSKPKPKPHVAVLAFPFSSHTSGIFCLARRLAELGPDVTVSYFGTAKTNSRLSSLGPTLPNLKTYSVADGLPPERGGIHVSSVEEEIELFLRATPGNFREAMKGLQEEVSCVLSDAFLWPAGEMAEEMGLPWVAFWIAGACSLSVHANTDLIRATIGTQPDEVSARLDESLSFIPCCSQFRVRDLPEGIVFGPLDFSLFTYLHRMSQELPRAKAVLINTVEEMDSAASLDHLRRTFMNKCLPVGPTTRLAPTLPQSGSESDPHSCLAWLGSRSEAPASVAYVCFGTVAALPPAELAALAEGLEASGVHFLWSLKDWQRESLPAGFLERTRGRGLVVPWVPQARVLEHVAVGAFINHCGWNSVLESVGSGVPMICRPFLADNRINARLLSHVLGVAVEVEGRVFTKDGVMDGLDLLLGGGREEGKKMRERLQALKLIAKTAVRESGSSTNNLRAALDIIKGCSA